MEKKRRMLYLFITLLVFGICTKNVKALEYENYFGITITNEQYNNLLNQGFNEEEIYYMNEDTFNENKDLNAELVSVNSKFYKSIYTDLNGTAQLVELTEEEYENESSNQVRGYVQTEYKRMDAYITKIDNTQFRYKVTVGWRNLPSVRSYDIIGVAFEGGSVTIPGDVYFNFTYCISDGSCRTSNGYNYKAKNYNGGSAVYKFPTTAISMTTSLYYNVVKNTTETITAQLIHGDYAHATQNVDYAIYSNHTMTRGGLSLGSSTPYYDEIPCADTGWTGTW